MTSWCEDSKMSETFPFGHLKSRVEENKNLYLRVLQFKISIIIIYLSQESSTLLSQLLPVRLSKISNALSYAPITVADPGKGLGGGGGSPPLFLDQTEAGRAKGV